MRKVFEVTGRWTKLHNVVHHDLCTPPNIIRVRTSRKMRWVVNVPHLRSECIQDFGVKSEGKRLLGRSRRRWAESITRGFEGIC